MLDTRSLIKEVVEAMAKVTTKHKPTPEETALARKKFDLKLWPGAWRELLRDSKEKPYRKLLAKYKQRTEAGLSLWYVGINGGKKKPVVQSLKLARPDVTVAKVKRLAKKLNASQIARKLKTGEETVRQRAKSAGIKLKNGLTTLKRPDVTREKILRLRGRGKKFREIMKILDVDLVTIFRRLNHKRKRRETRKAA
ncbi:hypothetical protein HY406_00810 [Candidatus Giovannonibacteria bacterium]|nr:hypothetical protein [Candidatus Giovannonibacteria bacterium]